MLKLHGILRDLQHTAIPAKEILCTSASRIVLGNGFTLGRGGIDDHNHDICNFVSATGSTIATNLCDHRDILKEILK